MKEKIIIISWDWKELPNAKNLDDFKSLGYNVSYKESKSKNTVLITLRNILSNKECSFKINVNKPLELQNLKKLEKIGLFAYIDPLSIGTDTYSFVFSDQPLTSQKLNRLLGHI